MKLQVLRLHPASRLAASGFPMRDSAAALSSLGQILFRVVAVLGCALGGAAIGGGNVA